MTDNLTQISSIDSAKTESLSTITQEGEIPCVIVFSDKKHVPYIYTILNPIREWLSQNQFKVFLLSEETPPDAHFGETIEEIIEKCPLGIVIFDGLRPNVLYEYGLLRGKNKIVIPIQDQSAFVAVKSYFNITDDSQCNKCAGLTPKQYNDLKQPRMGFHTHLSDRHGCNIVLLDHDASDDDEKHPRKIIQKEIEKLKQNIIEKYSNKSIEFSKDISRNQLKEFHALTLKINSYYAGLKRFTLEDIEICIKEINGYEEETGVKVPLSLHLTIASLYKTLADRLEWNEIDEKVRLYKKAIDIYEAIETIETDVISKTNISKIIGDCYYEISKY